MIIPANCIKMLVNAAETTLSIEDSTTDPMQHNARNVKRVFTCPQCKARAFRKSSWPKMHHTEWWLCMKTSHPDVGFFGKYQKVETWSLFMHKATGKVYCYQHQAHIVLLSFECGTTSHAFIYTSTEYCLLCVPSTFPSAKKNPLQTLAVIRPDDCRAV